MKSLEIERPVTAKLGGGVLYNTAGIERSVGVINDDPDSRVITGSALGKDPDDPNDIKITDSLIQCSDLIAAGKSFENPFELIHSKLTSVGRDFGYAAMPGLLDELKKGMPEHSVNWRLAQGEYVTGQVVAYRGGWTFVDPRELIELRKNGTISLVSYRRIAKHLPNDEKTRYFVPGYYTKDWRVFPRGGTDITGAALARGTRAKRYDVWKATDGVKATNPKVILDASTIAHLTYEEMRELLYLDDEVLQRYAILPVMEVGIPVRVRSTHAPDLPGTLITEKREESGEPVIGVAGKGGFVSFDIRQPGAHESIGFGSRILGICRRLNIPYDHSTTSQDKVSVYIHEKNLAEKEEALYEEFRARLPQATVKIDRNLGIVCVVGRDIKDNVGSVSTKLFGALTGNNTVIRADGLGQDGINIFVVVNQDQLDSSIRALYDAFIR